MNDTVKRPVDEASPEEKEMLAKIAKEKDLRERSAKIVEVQKKIDELIAERERLKG